MQTLRQIKNRIRSVANTRKITSAMQLVSAAKLSRSRAAFHSYRVYAQRLESVLKRFAGGIKDIADPLFKERTDLRSIAVCAIASDSGLCGNYNDGLLNTVDKFLSARRDTAVTLISVGQEVTNFMRKRGLTPHKAYPNLYGKYNPAVSDEITDMLKDMFLSGKICEAYIAYTRFSPSLRHAPVVERFLPIKPVESVDGPSYISEPDRQRLLSDLVSHYLMHKIRSVMLEAFTSEHSARMFAMKNATDNADELIDTLTLQRNKARQAAITQEITEIAMSAEALKG